MRPAFVRRHATSLLNGLTAMLRVHYDRLILIRTTGGFGQNSHHSTTCTKRVTYEFMKFSFAQRIAMPHSLIRIV